jgi:hypothetical protein
MRLNNWILTEGKKMSNPMIGYGINPSDIKAMKNYLISELTQENIRFSEVKDNHVTISQILGTYNKDELVRMTQHIDPKLHLYPVGLKLLRGKKVPKDFIVIEFKPADKFIRAVREISDEFKTMKFPKITPHLSLFTVRRGAVSDELIKSLDDSKPRFGRFTPNEVQLWNAKHEKEYTK